MNNATNTAPTLQCIHKQAHPRLADLFTNGSSKTSNASPLVNDGVMEANRIVGYLSLKHGERLADEVPTIGGGISRFAEDHFILTRNPKFLELEQGLEFPYALWLDSKHFVSCAITSGSLIESENDKGETRQGRSGSGGNDQTVIVEILYSRFETIQTLCGLNPYK